MKKEIEWNENELQEKKRKIKTGGNRNLNLKHSNRSQAGG